MKYVEMTMKEAIKKCNKNATVLVAIQDLTNSEDDVAEFTRKHQEEYENIFNDVKTIASVCDDFVKQLRCFTEKQDIYNIKPIGKQKIILLRN